MGLQGNQGADKGKPLTVSFQHLILRKLNVLIIVETLKEMVSIMALQMLKSEFKVVIKLIMDTIMLLFQIFFCDINT